MQKQVPKARRNSNVILWHPCGVRPPEGTLPGGRSPFTLNDHRLLSANPPGLERVGICFCAGAKGQPGRRPGRLALTLTGATFQMRSQYSRMARSEEK